MYRCEAASVRAFVQQVAVSYAGNGYLWYVEGWVPEPKDPVFVDKKLVAKYGIDISDSARWRRKKRGVANFQYIRHGRFFMLMATHGERDFFDREEGTCIRYVGKDPVCYAGYSIGYRNGHPSVRIGKKRYAGLRARFLYLAVHRSAENLTREFTKLRFQPFYLVKSQLWRLVDEVNVARKKAGYEQLPYTVIGPVLRRVRGPLVVASVRGTELQRAA